MVNWILTGFELVFLAIICLLFVAFSRKVVVLYQQFRDFAISNEPDKPSKASEFFDALSHRAGKAVALEIKTTLMGKASGESRLEAGIAKDILADQNPAAMALINQFPSLGKRVTKNPLVLQFIMNALSGAMKGSSNHPPSGEGFAAKKGQF